MASNNKSNQGNKSDRGFASMDPDRQKEIASEGGKAAHESGNAHEFSSEEAREAGRKGGQASSGNRGTAQGGSTENQGRSASQSGSGDAGQSGGGNQGSNKNATPGGGQSGRN